MENRRKYELKFIIPTSGKLYSKSCLHERSHRQKYLNTSEQNNPTDRLALVRLVSKICGSE